MSDPTRAVPGEIRDRLASMLAVHAEDGHTFADRHDQAEQVIKALEAFLDARPVRAEPTANRIERPKLPLLRATHTVSLPSDPQPVTVEMVITAETVRDDDSTAEVHDLPELDHAGWIGHMCGPVSVHVRIIP